MVWMPSRFHRVLCCIGDPGLAHVHLIVVTGSPLSKLSAQINKFPIILRVIICKITSNQRDKHSCKPIRFSSKFRSLGSRRVFIHYAMPTRTTIIASCSSDSIPPFPHWLNVRKINERIRKSKPCLIVTLSLLSTPSAVHLVSSLWWFYYAVRFVSRILVIYTTIHN